MIRRITNFRAIGDEKIDNMSESLYLKNEFKPSPADKDTETTSRSRTAMAAIDPEMRADPGRPFWIKYGKHLRPVLDRFIARSSLVSTEPVLSLDNFPWTMLLRDHWEAIRDEAILASLERPAPSLASISPDHRAIAAVDQWRSFFLLGYGYRIHENLDRCPTTASLIQQIPTLVTAFFSILAPGACIPPHRGVTKGLMTCHLGLIVPASGDVGMRVDDQIVRWSNGGVIVFDDTFDHEVWNLTDGVRVVLLLQFRRPLKQPGKWFVDKFLGWIQRSAFVQEALDNLQTWNAAMQALETDTGFPSCRGPLQNQLSLQDHSPNRQRPNHASYSLIPSGRAEASGISACVPKDLDLLPPDGLRADLQSYRN